MNRRDFLAAAAAVPVVLATEPTALARGLGGTPTALVTADTEAHVVAVRLPRGQIARRIATLDGPRSIESSRATTAIVAHSDHGAVTLIDGAALSVERVLRGFSEPRYTACHPNGRHAYVTDSGNGELAVIDLIRRRVLRRIELGGPARHITIDPRRRTLWTSLGSKAARIAIVDIRRPARPRLVRTIRPPFLAHDVAFSPFGTRVWVTSGDARAIAVYDAKTRRRLFTLDADSPPQHLWFSRHMVYATSGDDGTLRTHANNDGRLLSTAAIPVGSYNVTGVTNGRGTPAFSPSLSQGTLALLGSKGRVRWQKQVAPAAHDACYVTTQ